jgi:indole-3-glycerol phosphate synthase
MGSTTRVTDIRVLTKNLRPFRIIDKAEMPASLETIVAAARQRVSQKRSAEELRALERAAAEHAPRGFRQQLRRASQNGVAVIAELKKASPSKGVIRPDFRPAALAHSLETAGAAALSVLTDEEFFQGSLDYLRQASAATHIPCLRKDFIVDRSQILEARAHGADAILLIVAALNAAELLTLTQAARQHGLDVLCEAHTEDELQRALAAGCDLIGINSRDLRSFKVDLATAFRLVEKIPAECVGVAESGIHSGAEVARLRAAGYDAFLIGESLMRAEHPDYALKSLMEEAVLVASTE